MNVLNENNTSQSLDSVEFGNMISKLMIDINPKDLATFKSGIAKTCFEISAREDETPIKERIPWLELGSKAGHYRCYLMLKVFSKAELVEETSLSEYFCLLSFNRKQNLTASIIDMYRIKDMTTTKILKWLQVGAEHHAPRCRRFVDRLVMFDSIGLSNLSQIDIIIGGGSSEDFGSNCVQFALDEYKTNPEKARQWLNLGASRDDNETSRRISELLISLEPMGELTNNEFISLYHQLDENRDFTTLSVCYAVLMYYDTDEETRGMKWMRFGSELPEGNDYRDVLRMFPEDSEEDGNFFDIVTKMLYSDERDQLSFSLACSSDSLSIALHWLRVASMFDTRYGAKAGFCLSAFSRVLSSSQFELDEAAYRLYPSKGSTAFSPSPFPLDPSYSFLREVAERDEVSGERFLRRTLLSGSLKKNQVSSLYQSFFQSSMREVNLFPIISTYLQADQYEEDTINVDTRMMKRKCRQTEHASTAESIALLLFLNCDDINRIVIELEEREVSGLCQLFIPLLLSQCYSLLSLEITYIETHFLEGENLFDMNCLKSVSVCRLEVLKLVDIPNTSLSFPSSCDFTSLNTLSIDCCHITSLEPLTHMTNFSPRRLLLKFNKIKDISHLSLLDLSECHEPIDLSYNEITDLTCLEDISQEGLRINISGNPVTIELEKNGLQSIRIGSVEVFFDKVEV